MIPEGRQGPPFPPAWGMVPPLDALLGSFCDPRRASRGPTSPRKASAGLSVADKKAGVGAFRNPLEILLFFASKFLLFLLPWRLFSGLYFSNISPPSTHFSSRAEYSPPNLDLRGRSVIPEGPSFPPAWGMMPPLEAFCDPRRAPRASFSPSLGHGASP